MVPFKENTCQVNHLNLNREQEQLCTFESNQDNQDNQLGTKYRMDLNFRGTKLSQFSRFDSHPRKFSPAKIKVHTVHIDCFL